LFAEKIEKLESPITGETLAVTGAVLVVLLYLILQPQADYKGIAKGENEALKRHIIDLSNKLDEINLSLSTVSTRVENLEGVRVPHLSKATIGDSNSAIKLAKVDAAIESEFPSPNGYPTGKFHQNGHTSDYSGNLLKHSAHLCNHCLVFWVSIFN